MLNRGHCGVLCWRSRDRRPSKSNARKLIMKGRTRAEPGPKYQAAKAAGDGPGVGRGLLRPQHPQHAQGRPEVSIPGHPRAARAARPPGRR